MSPFDAGRRMLLRGAATAAAAVPLTATLQALSLQNAHAGGRRRKKGPSPYGVIEPSLDHTTGLPLLQLPRGFEYRSLSWTGDVMEDGNLVPARPDGMAVVDVQGRRGDREFVLIRNHENGLGPLLQAHAIYDRVQQAGIPLGGGTTNLYVPRDMSEPVRTVPSLGGTIVNCAGGLTPWGSWLTCEETLTDARPLGGKPHGYVFEVGADPRDTTGEPIVEMGRMPHEAVAVDPETGTCYLTEDNRNRNTYYRYLPRDCGQRIGALARGGKLQAAKVKGVHQADLNNPQEGDEYELEWVDVDEPDQDPANGGSGPWNQGRAAGALLLGRGEGIWYHCRKMYIVDTAGGVDANGVAGRGEGSVWEHDLDCDRLRCVFVSSSSLEANNPDNITVTPSGALMVCEDGGGVEDEFGFGNRLLGITEQGGAFIFAKNNVNLDLASIVKVGKNLAPGDYRGSEFCGACFDAKGRYLFVNLQAPGITFQIWGPWGRGNF